MEATELAATALQEIRQTIRQARSEHGSSVTRRSPQEVIWRSLRDTNKTVEQLCDTLSKLVDKFDPFCEEYNQASCVLEEARKQIRLSSAVLAKHQREFHV